MSSFMSWRLKRLSAKGWISKDVIQTLRRREFGPIYAQRVRSSNIGGLNQGNTPNPFPEKFTRKYIHLMVN
jgi:hypothetical protein